MSDPLTVDAARRILADDVRRAEAIAARACGWARHVAKRSGNVYWQHRNGSRKYGQGAPWPLWHSASFIPMLDALADSVDGDTNDRYATALRRIAGCLPDQEPVVRTPMGAAFLALAEAGLLKENDDDQ